MYNENEAMNVDDFRNKDHDFINQTLNKMLTFQEEVERLDVNNKVKIMLLDARDMRMRLRQSPIKCQEALRNFIPKLQFEKLEALCEILKVEFGKVSRSPKTID